jgi:DNA-directed RNA polymerase specialized sigma24 family protein
MLDWQELQAESVADLLEFVKLRGDQEAIDWSKAAFVNLTFKFRGDLLRKCTSMCYKANLTETDAEELANRVFEEFYKYPNGFNIARSRTKNPEIAFRLYLFGIARKELYDITHPDEGPYDGSEQVITSLIDPRKAYQPEQLVHLKAAEGELDKAFSHLTPKHKIIYLTYLYHEREGKYLPARLRKELVNVLGGVSKSTIRVYKKQAAEAIKKIKDAKK